MVFKRILHRTVQFLLFGFLAFPVSGQTYDVGDTLSFWAYDYGFYSGYYQTSATCLAVSDHMYIFVEDTVWNSGWFNDTEINQIIDAFEDSTPAADSSASGIEGMTDGIYYELTSVYGLPPDVDNDTLLFVLLLDVRDYWDDEHVELNGLGGRVVDGDFWASNELPGPQSMEREVIYIDVRRQSVEEAILALTHQFQRMLNWNLDNDEWRWVDEGLAMMAEYLVGYQSHQSLGFQGFDDISFACQQPLTGWNNHYPRLYFQQAYLFMMYLYEKYGGITSLEMIANEPENSTNGIQNVLSTLGYESNELEILFKDLAMAATYLNFRPATDPVHPNPRYAIENLTIGSITDYRTIYWGMNNVDDPPYAGDLPPWSCSIYNGRRAWSTELDSLLVFDGVDQTDFTLEVLWNDGNKPDSTSIVHTMVLDNNQEGSTNVDSFFVDYRSYSIVITAQSDFEGNRNVLYSDSLYIHLPPRYLRAWVQSENSINLQWYPPWMYSTESKNISGSEVSKHHSMYKVDQQLYELLSATLIGYNVYRSDSTDGDFEMLMFTDTTRYIDNTVIIDQIYYHVVTAVYENPTGESEYSNISSATATANLSSLFTAVSNYGIYGDPQVPDRFPSMEWPGGSGVHHLWEGRLWVGAIVDSEKWVSHADYGDYEFHPPEGEDSLTVLGTGQLNYSTNYNDYVWGNNNPLGIDVIQGAKMWKRSDDNVLSNTLLIEIRLINAADVGPGTLNDVYVSWVFDCDVGTGFDHTNPHIDDLVDYDGWDGPDSDSDLEDIVENLDWNGNGELDGYDEYGIPFGWQYLGSQEFPNPNYDLSLIVPDGFPDEYQVVVTDSDTVVVSRMMSYMYDGDDPATPGDDTREGGGVPGFIGLRLISSPTGNVFSHQWWNWEDDPGTDQEKYDYMIAEHEASMGYRFIPHPFTLGSPTFDYRFMLTTGPFFGFASGDTIRTIVGAVLGTGIRGLRQNADSLILALDSLGTVLGVERPHAAIPDKLTLHQNYPNPFNPTTTIEYDLPEQVDVVLTIYDILGREVRKWQWQKQEAGYYSVTWDGTNYHGKQVAAGVYMYRVQAGRQAGNYSQVRKMVLLK